MKLAAFLVFAVLVVSTGLGFEMNLGPGLSAKNVLLYILVAWIFLDAVIDQRNGGFFGRSHDYMLLHVAFIVLIFAAVLSSVASLLIVRYPGYSPMYAIVMLKTLAVDPYLMLFVFLAALRSVKEVIWMAKAMVIAIAFINIVSLVDMWGVLDLGIMTPREDGRLQGPLGSANEYGALMAFYIPIIFAFFYRARGWARVGWVFAALLCSLVLLFSTSRGAVVGLLGGAIIGWVLARAYIPTRYVIQTTVTVACIAVVASAVLAVQYGDLLYARFVEQSVSGGAFSQSSGRTEIWGDALSLMSATPVTLLVGFGWKTFALLNPISAHNMYLEFFFELGLVGVALMMLTYFLIVSYVLAALKWVSPAQRGIFIGFLFGYLSYLVSNLFGSLNTAGLYVLAFTGVMLRFACVEKWNAEHVDPRAVP